jgi:hypothetical protein
MVRAVRMRLPEEFLEVIVRFDACCGLSGPTAASYGAV